MDTVELTRSQLDDALEIAQIFPEEDEDVVRENYSGRGMYGRTCVGIVVGCTQLAFKFFAALAMEDVAGPDVAFQLAEQAQTDSMGRDMIVYFPRLTLINS